MRAEYRWSVLLLLVVAVGCGAPSEEPADTIEEVVETVADAAEIDPAIQELKAACAAAADAIAARQAEASLYDRLGGREAIHAVTVDIVGRHHQNEVVAPLFEGVDDDRLIENVTVFLCQAAGGDEVYEGADMVSAHAHLNITDEEFLSAGEDVRAAMEAAGVGPEEIEEVMCMFASLYEDVTPS